MSLNARSWPELLLLGTTKAASSLKGKRYLICPLVDFREGSRRGVQNKTQCRSKRGGMKMVVFSLRKGAD